MDTNNYNYYEEDDEISLLNLIGYVFRHLKKMLIVSIVVALVLGGLLGYKKSRVNEEEYSENMEEYLATKEDFDKKLDLSIKCLNNYIDESSFFELTADDAYQAKALYFVDTGYRVIPNSTYQDIDYTSTVISAYINKLTSNDVLKEIAKKYNISENTIHDYIAIWTNDYMININVYYDNENDALAILHELEEYLLSYNDEINSTIVNNSLSKVSETVYQGMNSNTISIQQNKLSIINSYVTSLIDVQTQLESLEVPQSLSDVSFSKKFIKYGMIGFIGVFFVMCVCYALSFLFSDKVYSADEFKDKTKIKVLGNLTYKKNNDKYIGWINKLEKRPVVNNYELIASNINAYGSAKKILLSSNLEDSTNEDIVSNLNKLLKNVEVVSCGSLLTDPTAVNMLDSVDSVVLIVKCNKSSYKDIKEEKSKLNDLKVSNVYAIVIE